MRAILLAAGMGTRLRPLTLKVPKSLIEVNNKPLLERQVEMLKEIGISEIIVLTGYLSEKFEYLTDKYGVKLIHNNKFDIYNNIYTMYLVKDYLKDSYVIDADVYINRNFLTRDLKKSTYFTANKIGFENEWKLHFDQNNKVKDITVESGNGYILSGVSYWNGKDGGFISNKLAEKIEQGCFKDLYWDDIVKENLKKLDIEVLKIKNDDIFEIDNLEDLAKVNKLIKSQI